MELTKELSINKIKFMYGKISTSTLVKLSPSLGKRLN
jgi:hypothetical protein